MIYIFVFLIGVASLFFWRLKTWKALAWPAQAVRPPPYQAHRGYWKAGAQENTLASFRAAALRGSQMFELDVRLSQDGIPVVFHDDNLNRIGGQNLLTQKTSAAEICRLTGAPTLEQVLTATDVPPFINIELKTARLRNGDLEKAVADLVKKHQAESRVLFSSFNPLAVWRLRGHLPQVPRALLASKDKEPGNHFYLKRLWFAPFIGVNVLNLDANYWSPEDVQELVKREIPVALWTVNDPELAKKYLQAGALSIISDTL